MSKMTIRERINQETRFVETSITEACMALYNCYSMLRCGLGDHKYELYGRSFKDTAQDMEDLIHLCVPDRAGDIIEELRNTDY